eukprot:COSAG01_NODE_497_length_16267_cov_5.357558_9_plen_149_part_00
MPSLALLLVAGVASKQTVDGLSPLCGSRADCSGHGECVDGVCLCAPLYEGTRCDVWRAAAGAGGTLQERLRHVEWLNCTHGRPGSTGLLRQFCTMKNKSLCEQVGAPTVPPGSWDRLCYEKPRNPPPGSQLGLCKDFRGVATVIHGLK